MDEPTGGEGKDVTTRRPRPSGRLVFAARTRVETISSRSKQWVEGQHPGSRKGVAIGAWKRYQAVEGPLQSVLLTAYMVVAVLPALLVLDEYLDDNPSALSNHLVHHFGLTATTGALLHSVLVKTKTHEFVSALIAIASALIFGLNFGRTLQIIHTRTWGIPVRKRGSDLWRFTAVLLGLYGLILLLLVQNSEIAGHPSWAGLTIAPGWVALLLVYFAWAPWLLTRKSISFRDLLPGAALTALALVVLMIASSFLLDYWINFYAGDYGGFGVVMAFFFWIGFGSTIIVATASISPALAERRDHLTALRAEVPAS